MLQSSVRSSADVATLWAVVSDVQRWGERLPTVTSVRSLSPEAPIGVGSRFEVRQPRLATAVYEVTEWSPGESFTWMARRVGVTTIACHQVTADGSGSRLDLALEWSGPLGPIVRRVLSRTGQRYIDVEATTFARLAADPSV